MGQYQTVHVKKSALWEGGFWSGMAETRPNHLIFAVI